MIEQSDLGDGVFTSVCASTDTVQYYLEKERYTLTIDFLKGNVTLSDNMKPISFNELKRADEDFWKNSKAVQESLKKFMDAKGKKLFDKYFKKESNSMDGNV
jgi:hypothetical protein